MYEKPEYEVADIINKYGSNFVSEYNHQSNSYNLNIMKNIAVCRTSELGGHVDKCNDCGHEVISYDSCRDRHCPKCQGMARAKWLESRQKELLNTGYFHIVFTVPSEIAGISLQNKKYIYNILFETAYKTLSEVSLDKKHLGAKIGTLGVLHTWGQKLMQHPHIHFIVPGGGISEDMKTWVTSRANFFVPVRILSRVFRGKFLSKLKIAFKNCDIVLKGSLQRLNNKCNFNSLLTSLYKKQWVVYSKKPFKKPEYVLKYLARYTHRIAISNQRIKSIDDGKVSFSWKDYANNCQKKLITLKSTEFIRRFLLHVLPKGFVHIRHYGFLANNCKSEKLKLCRKLIGEKEMINDNQNNKDKDNDNMSSYNCPVCQNGFLSVLFELPKKQYDFNDRLGIFRNIDTS